jgi:hypothetical protein
LMGRTVALCLACDKLQEMWLRSADLAL